MLLLNTILKVSFSPTVIIIIKKYIFCGHVTFLEEEGLAEEEGGGGDGRHGGSGGAGQNQT